MYRRRVVCVRLHGEGCKAVFNDVLLRKTYRKPADSLPTERRRNKQHGDPRFAVALQTVDLEIRDGQGALADQKMLFVGIVGGE